MAAMTSTSTLYFDPDLHPDDTLRAFDEFIQSFELRYDAQYPDPPKTSLDAAIERWKLANDDKKPTLDDYASVNSSIAHPPPPGQPPGICTLLLPGGRALVLAKLSRGRGIVYRPGI